MSRTFILASVAAVLAALTGTADQASAQGLKGAFNEVATKWAPEAKKEAAHVLAELGLAWIKQPSMEQPHFKLTDEAAQALTRGPNGVIIWKTPDGEQTRAAIAAWALTAGEPQAPAFK